MQLILVYTMLSCMDRVFEVTQQGFVLQQREAHGWPLGQVPILSTQQFDALSVILIKCHLLGQLMLRDILSSYLRAIFLHRCSTRSTQRIPSTDQLPPNP